jgi:TRAP-type mannitol/chloroaromatic compound transport system permease small subunit
LAGGLGWFAMGLYTLLAGRLPRWVAVTMIVSMALAAFAPLAPAGLSGIVKNVLLAAGPIAFGYALWAGLERGPTIPR